MDGVELEMRVADFGVFEDHFADLLLEIQPDDLEHRRPPCP